MPLRRFPVMRKAPCDRQHGTWWLLDCPNVKPDSSDGGYEYADDRMELGRCVGGTVRRRQGNRCPKRPAKGIFLEIIHGITGLDKEFPP